jgi:DNA-directed RNA polymerase subunit RPC12/RpoP
MKDKKSLPPSDEQDDPQNQVKTCFTCHECGENFEKPLLTNISSQGLVQTYYGCPYCLSKIPEKNEAEANNDEPPTLQKEAETQQPKTQNEKCQHFVGYLSKRPKETAIPEVCLTCDSIIECMAKN